MNEWYDREWLLTNGLGGYASSTVNSANTRHYHGLLVAAFKPPTDRKVLVAKIEERVLLQGKYFDLSCNQYPDVIHPNGRQFLKDFKASPLPYWQYANDNWNIEKSICMVDGENTSLVKYKNNGSETFVLELHPLYAYCDYHATFHEDPAFDFYTEFNRDHLKTYATYGAHPIFSKWSEGQFIEARTWYKNIQLLKSEDRGLDYKCDYYRIGYVKKELQPGEQLIICFSSEEQMSEEDLGKLWDKQYRKATKKSSSTSSEFYKDLLVAGNQFLVERTSTKSKSIIAGYHWFTDWGRDTMISMRGLTIVTGRKQISKAILTTFYKSLDRGMLPNRFPDNEEDQPEYNNMDATLWLFVATYEYFKKFKDHAFIKKHVRDLKEILDCHIKGTRFNIHVTDEGFLYGGQEGEQLTWMDAIVEGTVVTPRIGCPVEVNALWYNALKIYESFCKELKIPLDENMLDIRIKFEKNFAHYFSNQDGTLHDVIIPNVSVDPSFRPNQVFVLSLPFTLLDKEQQKIIFEAVKANLFTSYGLRTLHPEDPQFIPKYEGDQWSRDHAYHQGTVWPYLLHEYYTAFLRIYGNTKKNRNRVVTELTDLKNHFYEHEGIHCISEVFDGLNPHYGKGCIQQAWSVAALIKLYADYQLYELE